MPLPFLASGRPLDIAVYAGFRNETRLHCRVRILRRNKNHWEMAGGLAKLRRLLRLYASHEIPGVRVKLDAFGQSLEAVSDIEGFAVFDLDIGPLSLPLHARWEAVTVSLVDHSENLTAEAPILAPGTDGRLGINSDIDDTVIETGAHDFLRNWRRVLMEMPGDRLAVPGAVDLFGKLGDPSGPEPDAAPRRPFFYVSSSPWNLYGFIAEFKRLNNLPPGPMLLKDWGLNRRTLGSSSHGAHKIAQMETILSFYPDHRFVLVGDDTQGDAEAYATVVRDYPKRVAAVFLRMATGVALPAQKADALQAIRESGTPVWTGSAFDAGHAMLDELCLSKDGKAAQMVDATRGEGEA